MEARATTSYNETEPCRHDRMVGVREKKDSIRMADHRPNTSNQFSPSRQNKYVANNGNVLVTEENS